MAGYRRRGQPFVTLVRKHGLVAQLRDLVQLAGGLCRCRGGDLVGVGEGPAHRLPGRLEVVLHVVGLHVERDETVLDQVLDGLEGLLT